LLRQKDGKETQTGACGQSDEQIVQDRLPFDEQIVQDRLPFDEQFVQDCATGPGKYLIPLNGLTKVDDLISLNSGLALTVISTRFIKKGPRARGAQARRLPMAGRSRPNEPMPGIHGPIALITVPLFRLRARAA
jgi:hypothetical protein